MHALCAPTTLLHKSRISGHLLFLSFCISSSYRWSPGTYSIILVLVHQRIYIHWERTAPHPVVLNWDSFLCSVCCILRYMSVCITADRSGGERLGEASQIKTTTGEGEGAFRSQRIYTLYSILCCTLSSCSSWNAPRTTEFEPELSVSAVCLMRYEWATTFPQKSTSLNVKSQLIL